MIKLDLTKEQLEQLIYRWDNEVYEHQKKYVDKLSQELEDKKKKEETIKDIEYESLKFEMALEDDLSRILEKLKEGYKYCE